MKTLYVAFDGDSAGRQVGQAILMDDIETLHDVSNRITAGSLAIKEWVEQNGGHMISFGGDEGTFMIPAEAASRLEQARRAFKMSSGLNSTFGVGHSISQAGKALIAGKLSGKDQVKQYDRSVEQILREGHEHAQAGTGTEEEQKQDEHYLSDTMDDSSYPQDWEQEADGGSRQNAPESSDEQMQELADEASASDEHEEASEAEKEMEDYSTEENSMEASDLAEKPQEEGAPEAEEEQGDSKDSECDCEICQAINQGDDAAVGEEMPKEQAPEEEVSPDLSEGLEAPSEEDSQESFEEEKPITFKENKSMKDQESPEELEESAPQPESSAETSEEQDMEEQVHRLTQDEYESVQDQMAEPEEMPQDNDSMHLEQPTEATGESQPQEGQVSDMDMLSELLADAGSADETKAKIAQVLEKFKTNRELIMSMKESNPEMYQSIILMLKQMIDMARHLAPETPEEDMPQESPQGEGPELPKM